MAMLRQQPLQREFAHLEITAIKAQREVLLLVIDLITQSFELVSNDGNDVQIAEATGVNQTQPKSEAEVGVTFGNHGVGSQH